MQIPKSENIILGPLPNPGHASVTHNNTVLICFKTVVIITLSLKKQIELQFLLPVQIYMFLQSYRLLV